MLTLALETSTRLGSVALGDAGCLISESALSVAATHSETLLDEVDRMLARARVEPADVQRIVVGAGPGSFTGVRIAASLAKGWCKARSISLLAYSSLRAVSASVGTPRLCALFDARRGEVYAEAHGDGPLGTPLFGPSVAPIDRVLDRLGTVPDWRFAGEGATRHRDVIEGEGGRVLPRHLGVPRAAALLWLAHERPEGWAGGPEGTVADIDTWEPGYVRTSGAERQAARRG